MELDLRNFFGPKGPIAQRHPRYEERAGQIELAGAIDQALQDGVHLDAEAPAGTGKTFAYLVPLIQRAVQEDLHAVVVTANIALQEQLVRQDLPFLASVVPFQFQTALVKGLNNYLCLDRYEEALEWLPLSGNGRDDEMKQLRAWAAETRSGDRSDLEFEPSRETWRRVCGVAELCNGPQCRFFDPCFAMKARAGARRANLIVTNYHLLFAHLRVRRETGEDVILPPFEWIVCDEAHEMADAARDFFGHRLTPFSIRALLRGTRLLGRDDLGRRLRGAGEAFFDRVEALHGGRRFKARLRHPHAFEAGDLEEALAEYLQQIKRARGTTKDAEQLDTLGKCQRAGTAVQTALKAFLTLEDANQVYWIEREEQTVVLRSNLIDPGEVLRSELFDRTSSVISVSATLRAGGSFEFFTAERGGAEAAPRVVASPFDFPSQCLLVIPELPVEPNHPEFVGAMAEEINRIITRLGGRTMALFTSYRNLDHCARAARETGVKILRQGDKPRTRLLEMFRRGGKPKALFATTSFWQGVDIPGDPLSCLIIDRIPFPPPDEPMVEAIAERDANAFRTFSLPRAIIDLRQGFGRLIRSRGDRGAAVLFDGRLFTKSYGRSILDSLPECEMTRDVERIFSFLGTGRGKKRRGRR